MRMPFLLVVATAVALLASVASARTVMIGDSFFAGDSTVGRWLQTWAGHAIENKAIVGSSMRDGWTKSIPAQWREDVAKTPPPTTVIMNGGGNDVNSVRGDCEVFNGNCLRQINDAAAIGAKLLQQMHDDGVAHVIFMGIFYISPPLNRAVDYGTQEFQKICKTAPLDCHFADLRDLNVPRGWDGVHPTDEGYKMLAQRLWDVKLEREIPV